MKRLFFLLIILAGSAIAAGSTPTLIAHYKMNENTASDNDELVTNGDFAAWTTDNPDGWTVIGESGSDPMVNEVGTGQGQGGAGTGYCNIYTSDGTSIRIQQTITLIIGRKYRFSVNVDTVTAGGLYVFDSGTTMFTDVTYTTTGTKTFIFKATGTSMLLVLARKFAVASDVTFDDASIKLCAAEDSSGNDHDMHMQQDTDAISVTGKISRAFDFNGSSDYGEIADHVDFTPALTPFSISAWVYMHDATNFGIATKGVFNVDGEWRFWVNASDKAEIIFMDESVDSCYIGRSYNTALSENLWIHLVMTYDGGILSSGVRIYKDGVRADDTNVQANAASFESVENLDHDVWLGRRFSNYANGLIDNVMFFSVEFTQDEVNILYNAGSGTEIPAELDSKISPRRGNLSPLPLRRRWEF